MLANQFIKSGFLNWIGQSSFINLEKKPMSLQSLPNDPLFIFQWYLLNVGQTGGTPAMDLNVVPVWADYTGAGVRVAILDDGVDYYHPDLISNYDFFSDLDSEFRTGDGNHVYFDDGHGTSVAGVIAASGNNFIGGIGVAPNATISSLRIPFGDPNFYADASFAMNYMVNFDVANNGWGNTSPFAADYSVYPDYANALLRAVTLGRNGLGTVVVFSAGNRRISGMNTNYSNHSNSRYSIVVAALTHTGVHTNYSTPGASILISAFGGEASSGGLDGIITTDRLGLPGQTTGDYTNFTTSGSFGGTSAAASMVSGIVALMLEANPDLGYRDVQEILAYSARQTDLQNSNWRTNGASNWNGGGLRTSTDYGFGLVDARAAVRLAETWQTQSTIVNEWFVGGTQFLDTPISDPIGFGSSITLTSNLTIDHVEVDVNLTHQRLGDVELILVSPSGTESILMDRPRDSNGNPLGARNLNFTLSSTQFWGENSIGSWTLVARDRVSGAIGVLNNWSLRAYGDIPTIDNTYIYTNSFSSPVLTNPNRGFLEDLGGFDTLNAAAVSSNLTINLNPGWSSNIANRLLTIAPNTVIESAIGGDGNDEINGNFANNSLFGMRGNDLLRGFGSDDVLAGIWGDDWIEGGTGNDTLIGGFGSDSFYFGSQPGVDTITDFTSGVDRIVLEDSVFVPIFGDITLTFNFAANDFDASFSTASLVYSQSTGNLFYNSNGGFSGFGNGGQFATLVNVPPLFATDFLVV